jgi:predicted RNA-binding Zn-ribbon protein involved in translation (DUF1610 family)
LVASAVAGTQADQGGRVAQVPDVPKRLDLGGMVLSMAVYEPEDIGALDFRCPMCGWTGKGDAADAKVNDVVRCPQCGEALVREE